MEPDQRSARTKIVFLGGGASGIKFLQAAAKLPDATMSALEIILVDSKDYSEAPISMQRFLSQPEKAQMLTVPFTDALQAIGIGRFVQGFVSRISKQDEVVRFFGNQVRCLLARSLITFPRSTWRTALRFRTISA
jgi:NADH dehydrogenase FAD-containing subunit